MNIIHHVGVSARPGIKQELAALGIEVDDVGLIITFDIAEETTAWPAVQAFIRRHGASDFVSTKFSKAEIEDADWLQLVPDWHSGYPQPDEGNFGYLQATYDVTHLCATCGIGGRQKAPFQMRSEPKWGRRGVTQLHWVFDEYFVTTETWVRCFEPLGVSRRAVYDIHGREIPNVFQLAVDETCDIVTSKLLSERCTACHCVKFLPHTRGPFPALAGTPSAHMVKTSCHFGSGASASRGVLLSKKIARLMIEQGIRGAWLTPVRKAEGPPSSS